MKFRAGFEFPTIPAHVRTSGKGRKTAPGAIEIKFAHSLARARGPPGVYILIRVNRWFSGGSGILGNAVETTIFELGFVFLIV
jgi:hypothetical protein